MPPMQVPAQGTGSLRYSLLKEDEIWEAPLAQGCFMLVAQDGEVLFKEAYGYASLET